MLQLAHADDLERVYAAVKDDCDRAVGRVIQRTVVFFDLVGSTLMKLDQGHTFGTRAALTHNQTCRVLVERSGGVAVKDLGDGVLVEFENPVSACLAALTVRRALSGRTDTKAALAIGAIEEILLHGQRDIIGSTVDRCARMASLALPNQILIDRPLRDGVFSFLRDYPEIVLGAPFQVDLKGMGPVELFELSSTDCALIGLGIDQTVSPVEQHVRATTGYIRTIQTRWILSARLYQQPDPILTDATNELDIFVSAGKSIFHDRALCTHLQACALRPGRSSPLHIRVLFVHPDSTTIQTRAAYVGERAEDYRDYIADCVSQSVRHLDRIRAAGVPIKWRFYSDCPMAFRFVRADKRVYLSYYEKGQRETSPVVEYTEPSAGGTTASILEAFKNFYALVWDQAQDRL